jgi:hypothetical protein
VAQADTPLPEKASSEGRPRYWALAPVAMISASQVYSPLSPTRRIGFSPGRGVDVVEDHLGVEALGVLLEARHQLGALHAVGVGRPVVHFGGGHQLAALGDAGDEHGLQVGAGGVDGGGVAGGAGAEDQQLDVTSGHLGGSFECLEQGRQIIRRSVPGGDGMTPGRVIILEAGPVPMSLDAPQV